MDDEKIVSLHGDSIPGSGSDPEVIGCLEDALAAARRGELTSVSVVGLVRNGHSEHIFQIGTGQWFSMIGAVDVALHRLRNRLMGEANITQVGVPPGA